MESATISGRRVVTQTFSWSGRTGFVNGDVYEQGLTLNKEDGTFLNAERNLLLVPTAVITNSTDSFNIYKESSIFGGQALFGVVFLQPESFSADRQQTIIWSTGLTDTVENDTGGVDLRIGNSWCEAWPCVSYDTLCEVNKVTFGIIFPGKKDFPKQDYTCFDLNLWHIFLSNIMR